MKHKMKRHSMLFFRYLFLTFVMLMSASVYAQERTLTGSVFDENNDPIIGASVSLKNNSTVGTMSDLDGNFTLRVKDSDVLRVTYVGYVEQSISIGSQKHIKVVLKEDANVLEEMVVVGYGVMKKSDITGAMVNLGAEDIKKMPVANPLQAMQGKAAGVDITSNERPGEIGSIRIRGERSLNASNGPLYVVDGIPLQGTGIENINPSDIETIDVLKDASATAIYGSRGANGVVLVTTKRGKSGKMTLSYAGTVSFERMYDRTKMMNSNEWINFSRLAYQNQGTYTSAVPDYELDKKFYGKEPASWANFQKGWVDGVWNGDLVPTTDWTSHGLQTAVTQEHTLSASGGNEKMTSYFSFGYLDQEGTQPGQKYERYTVKTSVDLTPTKWLKLGASVNATYGDQDYGYNFRKSVTGASSLYFALQGMLPWTVPYAEDGSYIRNPGGDVNIINPINEIKYSNNQRQSLRAFASLYAEVEIMKGLKYRMNFGPDFNYRRLGIADSKESINGDGKNKAQYNTTQQRSWTLDNLIYYDKTIGKHSLGATFLQSASAYHSEGADLRTDNAYTSKELWYNIGSGGSLSGYGSDLTETKLSSYMVRANYGYNDKYLLTMSGRWDGASQLAKGHKWDFFPSAALGWRIEQEDFMKNLNWINQMKLRLGAGTTGNSAISAYATQGGISLLYYTWGNTLGPGTVQSDPSAKNPPVMANQKLGWEKTTQYNLGLDFSFFSNRLSGTIDLYKSRTKDLLMTRSIPSVNGFTTTWDNIGETENKGIDVTLNTVNVDTKDFVWTTNLTFSADRNKISKLPNGKMEDIPNGWFVGKALGVFYDYEYDGIWKSSEAEEAAKYGRKVGSIKVKDLNNDGVIDANNDRKIVGSRRPDWTAGLMNTVSYKNWELSFFLYSRWGFTMATGAETLSGRFAQRKLDYWVKETNENAKYPAPGLNGEVGDQYRTSMNYQDGSFIKLRNISLGYNFDKNFDLMKKIGVQNLKIYAQCMNPGLVYSKCDWIDPDLGGSTYNRSFVFGLNVGF